MDSERKQRVARGKGHGLRLRLILLVLLAFLPPVSLILYNAHQERLHTIADSQQRAQELVRQISDVKSRTLHSLHALLTVLAESPDVLHERAGRCSDMLRRVLAVEPDLANLGVTDLHGNVLCSAEPLTHPINVADRAYFRRALARHDFAVGTYEVGRISGIPVLVGAHPVPVVGSTRSVVFAAMKLDRLASLPGDTHLPHGAYFALHDSQHRILARYPGPLDLGERSPVTSFLMSLPHGTKHYNGIVRMDGRRYLMAFTMLPGRESGNELHAVLMIPAAEAFAYADGLTYRSLSLLAIASLAVVLLAWFGGEVLVLRPVRRLKDVAGLLAAGQLDARSGLRPSSGEIGTLTQAFDAMADALAQRERENQEQSHRIGRLNRIYHVLSAINGAIIRIRDRDELLREACRIAVEEGDFTFAWAGLVEPEQQWIKVIGHAGSAAEFITNVHVSSRDDLPEGRGTAGRALRSGVYAYSNDVENDPAQEAWREEFRKAGIRSIASFPLYLQERVVGVLVLNTSEIDFFDSEEIRLLEEVAADASLGLEHIEREGRLSYMANWDVLTGLPNRTLLCDRLDQAIERAGRQNEYVGVLAVDLSNLAEINDVMGRHVGDHMLKESATRLEQLMRQSEMFGALNIGIGRIGSHSFGVLLNLGTVLDRMPSLGEQLLATVKAPKRVDEEDVRVRVRIGVATFPQHGEQGYLLLRHAEFAAHSVSQLGSEALNYYSTTLDTKAQERHRLEGALDGALERDEFFLEYQPKVDVRTGQATGAEALLRWQSPEFGRVEPGRFVPILEETGLIDAVGAWVLEQAAARAVAWRNSVADGFVIAVNVAGSQLFADDFVARAGEIVRAVGAEPNQIELEITETRLVDHAISGAARLTQLKTHGFRIAVDDFGTGYSSLSYLRDLPIDTLKIDRSFITNIVTDPGSLSIVRTVIALAKVLHLDVVAEGVENEAQLELLMVEGCQFIQGFHFSRPLAVEQFVERCGKPFAVPQLDSTEAERILLIVDDEHNITQSLTRALRSEDYRVLTAHDAAEAFELLAMHRVQVVLSDLRMPAMDGTEFLRRVKLMYPNTVRMILTGYNDINTVTAAVNEGAIFKFVSKPWEDAFLRSALREAFELAADTAQAVVVPD